MHLELTEEQEFLRRTTRRFLEGEMPLAKVRSLYEVADGFDRGWWQRATELFFPEDGNSAAGDAVIVAEEMGRMVAPGPFVPAAVVAAALAAAGRPPTEGLATWAFAEPGGCWEPGRFRTAADIGAGQVVVRGVKAYVEAGAVADVFLVTARSEGGLTQVLVPAGTKGVSVVPGRSVDITRRFSRVTFDNVEVPVSAVVGGPGEAAAAVERQRQLAIALQCAELVGAAARVLESTLEYGAQRYAFGRPIVSYQALKHRIADMTVWMEGAKAVTDALAQAIDAGSDDAPLLARVAKAYVGEHCPDVIDDCVQITGGIGVTWEHDLHLYNRRAVVDRAVYGTPEEHKRAVYEIVARR